MKQIFLGLGTNLGEKKKNLEKAREKIVVIAKTIKSSPIYETPPFGIAEQPYFYNQVLEIETILKPKLLLEKLLAIEKEMGRVRTMKNGPRIIDIDILFYDNLILKTESLQIPHTGAVTRSFVLIPMNEIAPEFVHPIEKKRIRELCDTIPLIEKQKIIKIQ